MEKPLKTITIWARPKAGIDREWKIISKIPPDDLGEAIQKRRADYEYKSTFDDEKPE